MHCFRLLFAVLCGLLAATLGQAAMAAPTHITAELVAEGPAVPGKTVTLAFAMRPAAGWHGYWSNPGDAGLGMTLKWTLPPGLAAGELHYPVPETLTVFGLMNHVYEHDYAVLVPLVVPAATPPGPLPVLVEASWLACSAEICVPERAVLTLTLTVAAPGAAAAPDPRFDAWRARLPAPLGTKAQFALTGDRIRLGIPLPESMPLASPHFFAAQDRMIDYAAPQMFRRQGDLLIVELQRAKHEPLTPQALPGVLRLNAAGDGVEISAVPGPVPDGGEPVETAAAAPEPAAFPLLLLGALLGGLLLNVMPCVFPILSLKALSLARAGESEAEARREGLAYSAGVIVACLALGALLLALRAAGNEIGWAFQLQEPGVVAALCLLTVAITANLLGVFELSVPGFTQNGSASGAFATGLLAAFVATPCTGPFMAAAMGAALLLPVGWALALFATLGLGIALPFLAIAFIPALRRRMPKPGKWMVRFRQWMALPMALTALALFWLASRLGGWSFALGCAVLTVALVALLALTGSRQRAGKSAKVLVLAGAVALALVSTLVLPRLAHSPSAEAPSLLPSKPFSEAALDEALKSGKPVFAYFTADWCLTCKVNEQVAIERETTRDAFAKGKVVVLKGDWTRRDPAITRYLTAHGAAGVPLYVWYSASGQDAGKARVLPQVLTPAILAELTGPSSAAR